MIQSSAAFTIAALALTGVWQTLWRRGVVVSPATVAAVIPWFVVVGVSVAFVRSVDFGDSSGPALRTPAVYLMIGALVAALWLAFDVLDVENQPHLTAISGGVTAVVVSSVSLLAVGTFPIRVFLWNTVAVALAVGITAIIHRIVFGRTGSTHRWLGVAVLFAHVLDATTTAVGLERLGMVERNPISALIIHAGDAVGIPGVGLFLLVKTVVALVVVSFLSDDTVDSRRYTTAVLVIATGAGLVPAVHNLFVFVFIS